MKPNFFRSQKVLLIVLALSLVVLILLLPRIPEKKEIIPQMNTAIPVEVIDEFMENAKAELSNERKQKVASLEKEMAQAADKKHQLMWCDSLALYWKVFGKPEAESEYLKKYAVLSDSVKSWFVAGDAFFNNYRNTQEKLRKYMISNAVESYNHILEIDPGNLNAKNALGVCYVEGAADLGVPPMKGIGILREILEADPVNIDAQVNLGYFAIKSGQYDKAIERFNQVLSIDSNHIEAHLYLADIYVTTDRRDEAVKSLEKYKSFMKDEAKIAQIDEYIIEIKKSN